MQIAKPNVIGESSSEGGGLDSENLDGSHPFDGDEEFWHTSVGKFKFSIDTLPQSLQFIYQLLKEIPNIDKADILYYVLQCLNVMVLHGDAFVKAARDNRGFFIWCQENMLIKKYVSAVQLLFLTIYCNILYTGGGIRKLSGRVVPRGLVGPRKKGSFPAHK